MFALQPVCVVHRPDKFANFLLSARKSTYRAVLVEPERNSRCIFTLMVQLIYADNASLNAWRQDDLTSTSVILSQATQGADHHRLANLAIVKARLKQWESAAQDARTVTSYRSSIVYSLISILSSRSRFRVQSWVISR